MLSKMTSRRAPVRVAVGLLAWACIALGGPAGASPPRGEPVATAVPWDVGVESEGIEAIGRHTAGLGFLSGLELGLGAGVPVSGDETGGSFSGLIAGRLGPLAFGFGWTRVASPDEAGGDPGATHRFDLGWALRLGRSAALGIGWTKLRNDDSSDIDGLGTFSVSTTLRPFRGLALGMALDRFDTPRLGGRTLQPIGRISLGIRPATERMTLAFEGGHVFADDGRWLAGGSLRVMVIPGLTVGGYARYGTGGGLDERVDWGVLLGLNEGGLGLEASADAAEMIGAGEGEGERQLGLNFLLRGGTASKPSLIPRVDLVVKMRIDGSIAERPTEALFGDASPAFAHWLAAIESYAVDPAIAGIALELRGSPGWGQAWELRRSLAHFQARGKKVWVFLTTTDMRGMFLASIGDRLYLHPAGGLYLTGLSTTRTYYAELLSKLGVKAELVRWERYKAAPELVTRTGPSEPTKEMDEALLANFERYWEQALESGRGLSRSALAGALAAGPQTMDEAVSLKLVDGLVDDGAREATIEADLGRDIKLVEHYRRTPRGWSRWGARKRVVIVPIVGDIVDGSGEGSLPGLIRDSTGDAPVAAALSAAASDRSVAGIVVRVASGGGSSTASDRMYEAVRSASEKKPLVVSFGDVAASGGYYAAAGSKRILASPLTITGSIGIFGGKVDISGLYEKLGITTYTHKTTPTADMMGSHRPWTDEERERARTRLRAYYERFVSVVASGRGFEVPEAEAKARGRVWSGDAALAEKLIDEHGSLWDAIQQVKAEAGIAADQPVSLVYAPRESPLGSLAGLAAGVAAELGLGESRQASVPRVLGPAARMIGTLLQLGDGQSVLARMPYELEIR